MATLQFVQWSSDIELAFYSALASQKINHDKLDDSARKVLGLYEVRPSNPPARSCRVQIHGNALTSDEAPVGFYRAEGLLKNVNTFENYKGLDKVAVQDRAAQTIWDAIHDGTIYSCPSLLASFIAVCYADLKKYKFTYHFSFPVLHSEPVWVFRNQESDSCRKLPVDEIVELVESVQTWRYSVDVRQHGFFLAKRLRDKSALPDLTAAQEQLGFMWGVGSLGAYERDFFRNIEQEDRFLCFADPSTYENIPGWPLRNFLVLMKQRWHLKEAQILCYRDTPQRRDQANSLVFSLRQGTPAEQPSVLTSESEGTSAPKLPLPKVTGWERNEAGRLNSRTVDLAAYMDPQRLADQAVDLNLKLIKWRIAPDVDLDVIKRSSCLLLGAGTLGSYVARNLMAWGVRKITFVDNGRVSYSNPVRQPLFGFKDCLDGGKEKAVRAAEALKEIYPGVISEGHLLSIPMFGHPLVDEEEMKRDFEKLQSLVDSHDVIFLLLDTRESRWLPTIMGKAAGKIVMNAALGFDTFVVMRHGLKANAQGEEELGCYFCNDVVAPADSLKDATLDQQCTVTRPGIAPIASALLVELLVSILQHPLQARAPATSGSEPSQPPRAGSPSSSFHSTRTHQPSRPESPTHVPYRHPLGSLPHQLRGFLAAFSTLSITGRPFPSCSACSDSVISEYENNPWAFVRRAINERGWVEELSGLAEIQRRAQEVEDAGDIEALDDDGFGAGEEELI